MSETDKKLRLLVKINQNKFGHVKNILYICIVTLKANKMTTKVLTNQEGVPVAVLSSDLPEGNSAAAETVVAQAAANWVNANLESDEVRELELWENNSLPLSPSDVCVSLDASGEWCATVWGDNGCLTLETGDLLTV